MPTRLVLIEDHPALRTGLAQLLAERGCEVAGFAADAASALPLVLASEAPVALVGVHVGGSGGGIALTRRLATSCPGCGVVLYAGPGDDALMHDGLDAGARGWALASGEIEELVGAIRSAAAGQRYIAPRLRDAARPPRQPALSKREREVVDLLAQGLTGEQVADLLVISAETVKTHIRNAMTKLEASTRAHAVALALRDGEISAPPAFVAGVAGPVAAQPVAALRR